jgi:GTPase
MKFIDIAKIVVKSGNGGNGHISFRREKGVPKGGPDGGNGGRGGSIIVQVDKHLNTLLDFRYRQNYSAEDGEKGAKKRCTGRSGEDLYIKVPRGTIIKNAETEEIIADLTGVEDEIMLLKGGDGGRGNSEFATSTLQVPRHAEPGFPGKELEIVLELKLLADVGIVGFPNVGKSTLISVISAAKPKIADYPFTTLVPNLGIVKVGEHQSFTIADIPGLIEGASEGKGLGIQFLRHVERTKVLLFMIDSMSAQPKEDYKILMNELKRFNPEMKHKKRMICFSRIDAITEEELKAIKKIKFSDKGTPVTYISSVANIGTDDLRNSLWQIISSEE